MKNFSLKQEGNKYKQPGENLEDLGLNGAKILQKEKGFRFGLDAVLLADFAKLKDRESLMDVCTGSGIVPILLAASTNSQKLAGLELQGAYADMARRSVVLNGYSKRLKIHQGDLMDEDLVKSLGTYDVVTCNPPYKKAGAGLANQSQERTLARHEVAMDLPGLARAASLLLKDYGRFCLVHRPERLLDILEAMRSHRLEPKRIQTVAPKSGAAPNLILVEAHKNRKPYLKWEPEIIVYDEAGNNTQTIKEIYHESI